MDDNIKEMIMSIFASGLTLSQMIIPLELDEEDGMQMLTLLSQKHFAFGYAYFALAQHLYHFQKNEDEISKAFSYLKGLYNKELNDIRSTYKNSENK